MTLRAPTPRLLPLTIVALIAMLGLKSFDLVRRQFLTPDLPRRGVVAAAKAAGTEKAAADAPAGTADAPAPTASAAAATGSSDPGAKTSGLSVSGSATTPPSDISDSERSVLLELRQRREALEQRDLEVTARESALAAAERQIARRVDEMQALQKRLEALDVQRQEQEEAGWRGLVKLYESMKPRDAATIFNDLAMPVLLPVVDRMKDAKAAAIMAAMNPDKARDLTSQLARSRTHGEVAPQQAAMAAAKPIPAPKPPISGPATVPGGPTGGPSGGANNAQAPRPNPDSKPGGQAPPPNKS